MGIIVELISVKLRFFEVGSLQSNSMKNKQLNE